MDSDWMDEDSLFDDEGSNDIYCPYTNSSQCALMANGWQPQELCQSVECEQLKLFRHTGNNHRDRAA
ncbi:MAG: hypothetical protein ABFD54_08825 [Armatimonadota bacterium]|nr:hypothetical protein [bacterium]